EVGADLGAERSRAEHERRRAEECEDEPLPPAERGEHARAGAAQGSQSTPPAEPTAIVRSPRSAAPWRNPIVRRDAAGSIVQLAPPSSVRRRTLRSPTATPRRPSSATP